MAYDLLWLSITVGTAFFCLNLYISRSTRKLVLPPGPKPRWIIGNLLDIPRTIDVGLFTSWKRTYGDLVYLSAFGYSILILNSPRAISELLDKRGHNYSHRPRFVMSGELMGLGKCMALIDYGPKYKQFRKLTQVALNADAIRKYYPIQEQITAVYMQSLYRTPEDFLNQLRLTIGRVILAITYGLSVESADSKYIADAEETLAIIGKSTLPGAYMVDLIPALRYLPEWMPFTSFLQEAKTGYRQIYDFVTRPFEYVKDQIKMGTASPSFVADLLLDDNVRQAGTNEEVDDNIKWIAGTMYGGGVESSYATISTFFLLMALHPDKQAKAQSEIDSVIGTERLPQIQDKEQLPYVRALIQEVMRWHVVVPLGIARRTACDDTFMGYHIPANTIVVPNVHGLSQEDGQHSSTLFEPERFLRAAQPTDPRDYVFGFGRRICPGKYLAENSIFLIISNTLALYNITCPPGHPGNNTIPQAQFSEHLVSCPYEFKCSIQVRSRECVELLEHLSDRHC